jgi:hypothetical protein
MLNVFKNLGLFYIIFLASNGGFNVDYRTDWQKEAYKAALKELAKREKNTK